MPKKVKGRRKKCYAAPTAPAPPPGLVGQRETRLPLRLSDMASEMTCRLNGVLSAVIGLRECPTDQMFGGVIKLIEDLIAHAREAEEAAYQQSLLAVPANEPPRPAKPPKDT